MRTWRDFSHSEQMESVDLVLMIILVLMAPRLNLLAVIANLFFDFTPPYFSWRLFLLLLL